MLTLRIISFFLFFSLIGHSQIVINEVSTAQNFGVADEDGNYPDWIELYNAGTTAVDLEGYALVSENEVKQNWIFPSIIIQPNDYLIVFASEKDRRDIIDHWEAPIYPQSIWDYYTGPTTPPSNWNTNSFNTTTWNNGIGGIGYGDGDDSTIIAPTTTLYMRSDFILTDTSNISIGLMILDYDDSFVAYLNGVELARNNVGVHGTPPVFTDLAYEEHESQLYNGGNYEFFFFDRTIMGNSKNEGNNAFSLEAGFYSGSQTISINSNENGTVHYTTDGSIPILSSSIYTAPLSVTSNTVLKAVFFPSTSSILPSKPQVATYYIDENVSLPVISITTDPKNLWNYYEVFYVFGPNADSVNYPFIGSIFWNGWEIT
ncbi:MAG TPA: hypothetical protein EYG86_02620 [Crocinitomicaceae bacterium]|nr:hypothetical protein [Crocinitomicaceae bacterium]